MEVPQFIHTERGRRRFGLVDIFATSRHGLVVIASYRQAKLQIPDRTLRVVFANDGP